MAQGRFCNENGLANRPFSIDSIVVVRGRRRLPDLGPDHAVAESHPDALPDALLDLVIVLELRRGNEMIEERTLLCVQGDALQSIHLEKW